MQKHTELKRKFLNSLKRGTGEAYLIVKNNPEIDFSSQITKGALNIYAYDGQSEDNRADYIYDIICISNQKSKIRKAILQSISNEHENTWNLTHLFALTKLFAIQGDNEAKQAIYNRFLNNPIEGSDWVGAYEILELDGLNGLFFVAEKFGKYIEQNPDDWQDDWIIEHFQEENKNINVYEELLKNAKSNKYIHIYLESIKQTNEFRINNKKAQIKYKDTIDEILNSNRFIYSRWTNKFKEEDINEIANYLINETNKKNIARILEVFNYCKFPLESSFILNLAKRKRTSKNFIVENAISALHLLKSDEIREFAIYNIQNSRNKIDYLEILISNYQSGDYELLSNIANKTNDEHVIENLAGIFNRIFKSNKTKECKEPLEILYYKMNCAIHRNGLIEILIENDVLSERIKNEIKYDCYLPTRRLLNFKE